MIGLIEPLVKVVQPQSMSVAAIRKEAYTACVEYLKTEDVTDRLLLRLPAGVGKTYLGVQLAHMYQAAGKRVAFIMPRTNFYETIISESEKQNYGSSYWMRWLPRQAGDDNGNIETCHHTKAITEWMKRGHAAKKFCASDGICGYSFMQNECKYYNQANVYKMRYKNGGVWPIVAIQHQHLVNGHILMSNPGFDLIIGDESPLDVYLNKWVIKAASLYDYTKKELPAGVLMTRLKVAAAMLNDESVLSGPALLNSLGGAAEVQALIMATLWPAEDTTHIDSAASVERAPVDYLQSACSLLLREAKAAIAGTDYIHRATLDSAGLELFLRKETTPVLPARVIWLDATAAPELYQRVTRWKTRTFYQRPILEGAINQVTDGIWSKSTMVKDKQPTPKAIQTARILDHLIRREGYQCPLIVSYKDLAPLFSHHAYTWFGGNRGTNDFEHCDAVIVLGTPQPSATQLEHMARMVYAERMQPFDLTWDQLQVEYAGTDQTGRASGFWNDPDMMALLDQKRIAEIVQAFHRVRPISSPKPGWLFTALPIPDLPPTRIGGMLEYLGIRTTGIKAPQFLDALDVADVSIMERGMCEAQDLINNLGIVRTTAIKYLDGLSEYDGDQYGRIEAVGPRKRGGQPIRIGPRW